MSDIAQVRRIDLSSSETSARLRRRHAAERRFRAYGVVAIALSIAFLLILFTTIASNAYTALVQTHIRLKVDFDAGRIDPHGTGDPEVILAGDFGGIVKSALRERFPDVKGRRDRRSLYAIVSPGAAFDLQKLAISNPGLVGTGREIWLVAGDDVDMLLKGFIPRDVPESDRRINDKQIAWIDALIAEGAVEKKFNTRFFTAGDSREPELAGVLGAVAGSFFTMAVTLILAFPLGVATAVYMQEFAPKNRWTDLVEVNINNLAAVPSIVFGLLGLAVFLNVLHLPRSAPVVGGIVLALMTLPTIIIAGRAALGAVPPSIREAALGIGASRMQATFHHVLPLAMPENSLGDDHRHGPGAWRDGAAADDRDGRIHRGHSQGTLRSRNRAAGAGVPVGRQPRAGLRRTAFRGDRGSAGFPRVDERCSHLPEKEIRTTLVIHVHHDRYRDSQGNRSGRSQTGCKGRLPGTSMSSTARSRP